MLHLRWLLLIASLQGSWPCAAIAADPGTEGRTDAVEEFRFERYEYSGGLREMEEAVIAGLLRSFPVGSDVDSLIDAIERREPMRGRYCIDRTEDMVWCQYWHPWSGDPRLSIMYWVQIYHTDESRKIKDIGVKIVAG